MERVTVQYNGEMVTLDVPEGMSDDQIIAFLQQQDANKPSPIGQKQEENTRLFSLQLKPKQA